MNDDDDLEDLGLSLDDDDDDEDYSQPAPEVPNMLLDDVEFDESSALGRSAAPPPEAFVPPIMDDEPYSPPSGMPDTKALDSLKGKKLKQPSEGKKLGGFLMFAVIAAAIPGVMFAIASLRMYQLNQTMFKVHEAFVEQVLDKRLGSTISVGDVKSNVIRIAATKDLKLAWEDIEVAGHELELTFLDNSEVESCETANPPFFDQMLPSEQERMKTGVQECRMKYVVSYSVDIPIKIGVINKMARGTGYIVFEEFDEDDEGPPDEEEEEE